MKTYLKQKKQSWTRQKNIDDLFHLLHVLIIIVNSFSLIHLHQKSIHFSLALFLFVRDDCCLIYVLSRKFLTFWMSLNLCINAVNLGGMLIAWSEKYSGMTSNRLYTWISAMDTCESQKKNYKWKINKRPAVHIAHLRNKRRYRISFMIHNSNYLDNVV